MKNSAEWMPADDLRDEFMQLSEIERTAVEMVVYDLNNRTRPLTITQAQLVERVMRLPIAQKLNERKLQVAV